MMYVYTFYTDEEEISYIKETDLLNNMNVTYIKKDSWNGYTDEINETNNIIKNHNDNDIICFIHAYDVLINQDMSYLTEKFNNYNCDLLIGVELNCSIEKYINMYPNTTNKKNIYVLEDILVINLLYKIYLIGNHMMIYVIFALMEALKHILQNIFYQNNRKELNLIMIV